MVEEEEEEVVVMDSIDGPHEAWGRIIFKFLMKFTDEKSGYRPTDTPSYRDE